VARDLSSMCRRCESPGACCLGQIERRERGAADGRNQKGMKWVVNWVKVMLQHKHANSETTHE
jgi:hypothetical protein